MITNIIEIELLPADRVVTRPVHQWDIGQIIKVTDAEIEDGTPVDFGNRFMKGGLRAYVIDNQVTIPAPALQQERDLTGYVVITDENSETTVKEIAIPVIPRPKPEDYVDEEIRESTEFQYVISAVEAVEANAKAAAEAAGKAAGSETAAADAKQAAENAATAAAGSATSADASAKAAASSEQTASRAATTATEKATEAGNSESAAKAAKEAAEKAKDDAEAARDEAVEQNEAADGKISAHNVDTVSHEDIRLLISNLTTRLNALANSTDTDLDQMAELVTYIKDNRGLIEQITSGKVSVTDIVNNLTTNVSNKPLSAAQGVVLKGLIDALQNAVNAAAKAADLTSHTGNTTAHITAAERTAWNKNTTDIADLSNEVINLKGGELPDYWEEYLPAKIEAINNLQMAGGKDCFSFPHITDIHIRQNLGKYSGLLIYQLLKACYMRFVINNGDGVNRGSGGEADMDEDFETLEKMLCIIRAWLLQQAGNHDGSFGYKDYDGDGEKDYYAYNFTPEKRHALIYRKVGLVGDCHFDSSGTGYYIDDVSNKVRYIMLNTHNNPYEEDENGFAVYNNMWKFKLQQSQFDLVIEALSTVPSEEWCVVSGSHVKLNYNNLPNLALMAKLFNAYRTKTTFSGSYAGEYGYDAVSVEVDFSSAKGQYIAHVSGHDHIDSITVYEGITIITSRCDGANEPSESGLTKTAGTVTEQSFDVFTVNRKEKRIYITKIGAGDNRYWDYANGVEFDPNEEPVTVYSIATTLNNCTGASGNPATINEGGSATLTFTAKTGYELPSAVTVSGAGYTWNQNTGVLVLSNPTANVAIAISATEVVVKPDEPSYTNLANPSAAGWVNNSRIGSSGTAKAEGNCAGAVVTNYILVTDKSKDFYIKGLDIVNNLPDGNVCIIGRYANADETVVSGMIYANNYSSRVTVTGDVSVYNIGTSMLDNDYVRFTGTLLDGYTAEDVVISLGEPIE